MRTYRNRTSGTSLLELCIVMGLIGVLAVLFSADYELKALKSVNTSEELMDTLSSFRNTMKSSFRNLAFLEPAGAISLHECKTPPKDSQIGCGRIVVKKSSEVPGEYDGNSIEIASRCVKNEENDAVLSEELLRESPFFNHCRYFSLCAKGHIATIVIRSSAGSVMIPNSTTKAIAGVYACFDHAGSVGTVVKAVQVNTSVFYETEYGDILRKDRILAISTDSFYGKSDTRKEFVGKAPLGKEPPKNDIIGNRPSGKVSTVGK